MIRLWLSREHSIPIREQLSAQILLGIISRRLSAGERLPSVRELARRLRIHPNTVSAAYRDLAARGWVKQRKGSGVYVSNAATPQPTEGLDGFVRAWLDAATAQGFTVDQLESTLARLARQPPLKKLLVVDPDSALAGILGLEISQSLSYEVPSSSFAEAAALITPETTLLVLPAHAALAQKEFPTTPQVTIVVRSMDEFLLGYKRPAAGALIGIVSRSESIRRWSSTLLSALGFPPQAVLSRSPDKPLWTRGLCACHIVAADIEAFEELPANVKGHVMKLVSDEFLRNEFKLS